MASTEQEPRGRPQDWVSLFAGAYLVLAMNWVEVTTASMWAMTVIGVSIMLIALVAIARPGAYVDEWVMTLAGVAAFVAPWVLSFSEYSGAAWSCWIVGGVVSVAAIGSLPDSRTTYLEEHRVA